MGERLNTDKFYQQLFTSQQISSWNQLLQTMSQARMEEHTIKRQTMLHEELRIRDIQRDKALSTTVKTSTIDAH